MQEIAKAAPDPTKGAYSAPTDTLFGAGGGYPLRQPPPSALRAAVLGASRLVSWRYSVGSGSVAMYLNTFSKYLVIEQI